MFTCDSYTSFKWKTEQKTCFCIKERDERGEMMNICWAFLTFTSQIFFFNSDLNAVLIISCFVSRLQTVLKHLRSTFWKCKDCLALKICHKGSLFPLGWFWPWVDLSGSQWIWYLWLFLSGQTSISCDSENFCRTPRRCAALLSSEWDKQRVSVCVCECVG